MVRVDVVHQPIWEIAADGALFFLPEDFAIDGSLAYIEQQFYPHLKNVLARHKFLGKSGDSFTLTAPVKNDLVQFVFIGQGQGATAAARLPHENMELLRRAIGLGIKELNRLEIKRTVIDITRFNLKNLGVDQAELIRQLTIAIRMSGYEFDTFKSEKTSSKWNGEVILAAPSFPQALVARALFEGRAIADATDITRHLADLPGNIATPEYISECAEQIAAQYNLKCTIFGRDRARELGMGGFLAVDAGSEREGKFVELLYSCSDKNAPTIALVGKGVTFDSGGLSLKPSNSMSGMKFDMSGAAAVIGSMRAIAEIAPNVNVVGITPLVENMPSGHAARQDDIIQHMNGVTTEIESTDAEGRLILADALAYAEKFHSPAVIIDIATLTGAVVVALGHFFSGIMSRHPDLQQQLITVGQRTGDWLWPLPLHDFYQAAIKSPVADISNTGDPKYGAGTVKAACFLSRFVNNTPWAHLDIAGTENGIPDAPHLGKGASGVGVRLFVDFVKNFKK